eukprot:4769893-Amphidinium_carterae.1
MPFVLHNSQEALNDFLVNHQLERLSEPAEEPCGPEFLNVWPGLANREIIAFKPMPLPTL